MRSKDSSAGALPELGVVYSERPMSGWGGLVSVYRFFDRLGVREWLEQALPDGRTSPNQISVVDMTLSLFGTILTGGSRFSHVERIRQDEVVRSAMRARRIPSAMTLTRYFGGFVQSQVEHLTDVLSQRLGALLRPAPGGSVVDLDSSVFERFGRQEGSVKGHNPRRHGRPSHHPLFAMLAETKQVFQVWLRSGNSGTSRGVEAFLAEMLSRLPRGFSIRAVRADSGFFVTSLLQTLEERGLAYAIAVRMIRPVRSVVLGIKEWRSFAPGLEAGELDYQAHTWKKPRRLVVVREELKERPDAAGRRLFELPGYTVHAVVTTMTEPPEEVWRFYNGRAESENRLKELKHSFGANGFCLATFAGTEAVFRLNCLLFNLLAEFKHRILEDDKPQLCTLRHRLFVVGASQGTEGRKQLLRLALRGRLREKFEQILKRIQQLPSTVTQKEEPIENKALQLPRRWRSRRSQRQEGQFHLPLFGFN